MALRKRGKRVVIATLTRALLLLCVAGAGRAAAQSIPQRISDSVFWKMHVDMSEPDGYFRSDNFASNELAFQYVIPELNRTLPSGGVYLGVGPDQNFTYIAALKPRIAFILDIRRQNAMLHLMYKALMELSPNRVTFASKLYCRTPPTGLTDSSTANEIIQKVYESPQPSGLYESLLASVRQHLTVTHGFPLSIDDQASLHFVYSTFCRVGPGITYQGPSNTSPTWWDLQVESDGLGGHRAYMAAESTFVFLRGMQEKNLIIPVVGDFGGPKALRAIAKYLSDNSATVSAFYLSNVEQYLFQYDSWTYFYRSVATLPLDSRSTFIRSVFNNQGGFRFVANNGQSMSLLASMTEQVRMFNEGRLNSYATVIATSR
jgi:hypothetical protein